MGNRRWIRLDVDWEDSEWIDGLDGEAAGCWPRLLCWVKKSGVKGRCRKPSIGVLARRWRVSEDAIIRLLGAAVRGGMLAVTDGEWQVADWKRYAAPPFRPYPNNRWKAVRAEILERDAWTCHYCGEFADHVDHVMPRSRGGSDDPTNLVAACGVCNRKKGALTPEEWSVSRG